jgi:hypothetical protein
MAEVQPGDPAAKRLALFIVAGGFLAGGLLLWGLNAGGPAVAGWLRADPAKLVIRARLLLLGLAVLMAGPPALAGVYLLWFGARVVDTARFPPPGVRMVQDTVVLTGVRARRRGRVAQGLGVTLLLASLALTALLWALAPR